MDKLLEIRNLKVNFFLGKQVIVAVDGVNLDVLKSEVVVLAGESGSGKSITCLSITKILPATAKIISGTVLFEGKNLLELNDDALRAIRGLKIAYIFQEPTSYLNPVFSIGEQIIEAIMLHQDKPKKQAYLEALELLNLVKIKEPKKVLFDYPHQLSGGMNQRVFMAMSLALRPHLLIADEPTTSLDVTIEAQILQLLLDLKKQIGFSLLFITHNLSIAKKIADRIYVMHKGRIVEEGNCETIFNLPRQIHTKELINAYEKIGKI